MKNAQFAMPAWLLPTIVIAALAALYLSFPTSQFNSDSLMYACIIEAGHAPSLVDSNRLFYTLSGWVLHGLFQGIRLPIRSLDILQGLSMVSSVGVLWFSYQWLKASTTPLFLAGLLALLGTSSAWALFSSNPHSHMVSLLPLLIALSYWEKYLTSENRWFLLGTGVFWYVAVVFHESHALLGAVFLLTAKDKGRTFRFCLIVGLWVVASYAASFLIFRRPATWEGFADFLLGKGGEVRLYSPSSRAFWTTARASLFGQNTWAYLPLAGVFLFIRKPTWTHRARVTLVWFGVYAAFFWVFQPGNLFFLVFLLLPFVLTLGQIIPPRWGNRAAIFLLASLALHLPSELAEERRASHPENNPLMMRALQFRERSEPNDLFLLSSARDAAFKFYVIYFGLRKTIAVDLLFETKAPNALITIDSSARHAIGSGGRVYFLREILDAQTIPDAAKTLWTPYLEGWSFSSSPWSGVFSGTPKKDTATLNRAILRR